MNTTTAQTADSGAPLDSKEVLQKTASFRQFFPLLSGPEPTIYLDNAATALKPLQVVEALKEYYLEYPVNIHRANYPLCIRASNEYEKSRNTLRAFFDADDSYEIIFTAGTTDSINILAHAYQAEPALSANKTSFLVSDFEHHSSFVPWQQCARNLGKEFHSIPLTSSNVLDMDAAEKLIPDASVLSITGMSNVTGYVPPLDDLLKLCAKHGTRLVVDAAQLAAHQEISLKRMPVDALCCSAHKLCGPTGIGVLCVRREWLKTLPFVKTGGGTIQRVAREQSSFLDGPEGYEAGTPHIAGAIGFAAAINFLRKVGMQNIAHADLLLRRSLLQKLEALDAFKIVGDSPAIQAATVSIVAQDMHPHDMSFLLEMKKICVRTGHLCAQPLLRKFNLEFVLRISAFFYTTLEEIEVLGAALTTLQKMPVRNAVKKYQ